MVHLVCWACVQELVCGPVLTQESGDFCILKIGNFTQAFVGALVLSASEKSCEKSFVRRDRKLVA